MLAAAAAQKRQVLVKAATGDVKKQSMAAAAKDRQHLMVAAAAEDVKKQSMVAAAAESSIQWFQQQQ